MIQFAMSDQMLPVVQIVSKADKMALNERNNPYEKVLWYSHGATMVYHGKQWYTMVRCNCTMVQITCTMVDYGIPWYILTVSWHILMQPWFTELEPWCIMRYHGTSLHNHSTIYL